MIADFTRHTSRSLELGWPNEPFQPPHRIFKGRDLFQQRELPGVPFGVACAFGAFGGIYVRKQIRQRNIERRRNTDESRYAKIFPASLKMTDESPMHLEETGQRLL